MSTEIKRNAQGHFLKGHPCPNPGGRPKVAAQLRKRISELTNDGEDIVQFMVEVFKGTHKTLGKTPTDRKWAAEWLSDRLYGKAPLVIEAITEEKSLVLEPDLSNCTEQELKAMEDAGAIIERLSARKEPIDV